MMNSAAATTPTSDDFLRLAESHTLVPVFRTLVADLETPVSAFLRLTAPDTDSPATTPPEAFLLESVEGGERVGRYTFIGIEPYQRYTARNRSITHTSAAGTRHFEGDIFAELQRELSAHTPARLPGLPPFTAGAVGFFSYDIVRQIEHLPTLATTEIDVPDAHLMFFDQVLAFDHVRKEIHLIVTADLTRTPSTPLAAFEEAFTRLDRLEHLLARPLPATAHPHATQPTTSTLKLTPRTPRADFLAAVDRVQGYIGSGDVFQCVLSQRFDCTPAVDPFRIYRALRIINPSPYMYFLRFNLDTARTGHIVGSSPELLVRVKGSRVEYRPIAGTRRRDPDESADRALEEDLRNDAKEVAEHIMLVDLGRNDLGRVSAFGTVQVKDLMFVERYSHVMHLVSALEGTLRPGLAALDAFRACFPAGTLSGAPKVRAMEIIEELEPARRGVYGGSVLYADFSGNLDSCIAIRTLFLDGDQGHIQAGAGIVADSVPESEFDECRNKAQAVVRAIERARSF